MQTKKLFYTTMVVMFLAMIPAIQAQSFSVMHEFAGGADGAFPVGGVTLDAKGNVYGTTSDGGSFTVGVVFKVDKGNNETIPLNFDESNGAFPGSTMIQDAAGNFYGTADEGPGGAGVIFEMSPQGKEKLLYAFQGGTGNNARVPSGSPLLDKSGDIYGTTIKGGKGSCLFGCGAIYRLDMAGKLHVLYSFSGGRDGNEPYGPLVEDAAGNLYGVALYGGDLSCPEFPQQGCGVVFELAKSGNLTVLHTFKGPDGASPQPGLLMDQAGNLYGTAGYGGHAENGLLFKISPAGKYSVLHRFNGTDGSTPNGGLVADSTGNLYGTAQTGGADMLYGTIFEMTTTGHLNVLYSFTGGQDGANPFAGVARDAAGNLYGTAYQNFQFFQRDGNVWELTP